MKRISELHPNESAPDRSQSIVIAIGGVAMPAEYYRPMVASIPNVQGVCLELPGGGLGSAEKTYEQVRGQVKRLREGNPDSTISVVGHSLGGLMAARLAAEDCGIDGEVITLGTPHTGVPFSMGAWPMAEVQRDVVPGADFIEETLKGMKLGWPEGVVLSTVAATFDPIAPPGTQLGIKLPEWASPPQHFQVVSRLGQAGHRLGQIRSDWTHWGWPILVDHYNLPHAPGLQRWLGDRLTEGVAKDSDEELPLAA